MRLASISPPTHYKHTYTAPHHASNAVKTFSNAVKGVITAPKWLLVNRGFRGRLVGF